MVRSFVFSEVEGVGIEPRPLERHFSSMRYRRLIGVLKIVRNITEQKRRKSETGALDLRHPARAGSANRIAYKINTVLNNESRNLPQDHELRNYK